MKTHLKAHFWEITHWKWKHCDDANDDDEKGFNFSRVIELSCSQKQF